MRHKSILLLLVIALLMGGASSAAHSGRTDKNGGHRDSSTGEYHYHHGYPAHQHENGVCPYNYDDRTGWNSGSASSSKSTKTPKPEVIIEYVEVEKEQSKTGLYLLGGASGILLIFAFRKGALANARKAELENKIKEAQELRQIIMDLGGINPSRVIPKGTELGEDGLPREANPNRYFAWGERYTFFTSNSRKTYHLHNCRHAGYTQENAVQVRYLKPCKVCNPELPDLSWYDEYKRLKKLKDKYNL